jgi:hypothetical protein
MVDAALCERPTRTDGMIRAEGGTFRMSSDHHYPEEAPSHRVSIDSFSGANPMARAPRSRASTIIQVEHMAKPTSSAKAFDTHLPTESRPYAERQLRSSQCTTAR